MKHLKGFTLIELLVVISIVGLLSTLAIVSLNNARLKSRDVKRKADLKQIQTALEIYYDKFSYYPSENACDTSIGEGAACPTSGTDWDYSNAGHIGRKLRDNGIMQSLPIDPLNNSTYRYAYEPDCNQGRCPSPAGCCYYDIRGQLEGGGWFVLTGGGL